MISKQWIVLSFATFSLSIFIRHRLFVLVYIPEKHKKNKINICIHNHVFDHYPYKKHLTIKNRTYFFHQQLTLHGQIGSFKQVTVNFLYGESRFWQQTRARCKRVQAPGAAEFLHSAFAVQLQLVDLPQWPQPRAASPQRILKRPQMLVPAWRSLTAIVGSSCLRFCAHTLLYFCTAYLAVLWPQNELLCQAPSTTAGAQQFQIFRISQK